MQTGYGGRRAEIGQRLSFAFGAKVCGDGIMVSLFFRDLGGAGKPPLVLLHGLLGSSRNWLSAGGELAASKAGGGGGDVFHVFALDLRNHGRSPHVEEMSYEAMVGDVVAWLDEHVAGGGPVTLLGIAWGERLRWRWHAGIRRE